MPGQSPALAHLDARHLDERRHGRAADEELVLAAHGQRALRIIPLLERHKPVPTHTGLQGQVKAPACAGKWPQPSTHKHPMPATPHVKCYLSVEPGPKPPMPAKLHILRLAKMP